jgi:hypothetical protein
MQFVSFFIIFWKLSNDNGNDMGRNATDIPVIFFSESYFSGQKCFRKAMENPAI